MDMIKFQQEIIKYDNQRQELLCAKVIINEIPLIKTVHAYELSHAKKYNQESIAGGYMYNFAEYLYKLLSGQQRPMDYEKEIPILLCECGYEGCWDLIMTVEENDMNVIWKNFNNPRRSKPNSLGGVWDYSGFPSFCFDKNQYQDELNKLAKTKIL